MKIQRFAQINEYYPAAKLGKKGKRRIKNMLYGEVDKYIKESSVIMEMIFLSRALKCF